MNKDCPYYSLPQTSDRAYIEDENTRTQLSIDSNNMLLVECYDFFEEGYCSSYFKINYCPSWGRKLVTK